MILPGLASITDLNWSRLPPILILPLMLADEEPYSSQLPIFSYGNTKLTKISSSLERLARFI